MAKTTSATLYRDINLKISADTYVFSSPSSPNASALMIERPTGSLRLSDGPPPSSKRVIKFFSIAGILGLIQLRLDKYVVVVTKAKPMGRLRGQMLYKVVGTDLLPMRERQVHDPDEDVFLGMMRNILKVQPMYFAYSMDITNSFQRQSTSVATQPLWMRADDRFFWNRFLQSDLIALRSNGTRTDPKAQPGVDPFILPVISGMLKIIPTKFKKIPLTLCIVSRRSRHGCGTRFFTRGIDGHGNVANYNETEQIVLLNDLSFRPSGYPGTSDMQSGKFGGGAGSSETQILSFVQTRGSIPTYWAEINSLHYTPKLQIRGVELAVPAAQAHFDEQIRHYGDNYLINLVNRSGREKRIKESYEGVYQALTSSSTTRIEADSLSSEKLHTIQPDKPRQKYDRLRYIYYDFHSETKGANMQRANGLIERLTPVLQSQGYFRAVDTPVQVGGHPEARGYQTSVMRTNCLDCLDRTNVVQSMFARHMLDRIFEDVGLMPRGASFRIEDPLFDDVFRNVWADNADTVAHSYAGTGAMKTDITRTGRRTKYGALQDGWIAISRYYSNNFLDGRRQDSFDLFLGVYRPGEAIGAGFVFTDRRPALIQAMPYLLAFSLLFVLVALFSLRIPDSAVVPMRIFVMFWTLVAAWCFNFMRTHGMLFVQWPKLAPRSFALEGYEDHYTKASKSRVVGPFMAKHARGLSAAKYSGAEEGKKIE